MVSLFNLLGVLFWLIGLASFASARGAIHESSALIALGIGSMFIIGAALLHELQRHRPAPTETEAGRATPKK